MPDEPSPDDVRQAIRDGIAAADRGDLIDHDEVERRMAKWLDE